MENINFYNQTGNIGVFVYATTDSNILVCSCNFTDGKSSGSGGAIYGIHSDMTIQNSRFINTDAEVGGGISAQS